MKMTANGYNIIRKQLFKTLTTLQVQGIERLINAAKDGGLTYPETAYLLATTFVETDKKMQPIVEYGSRSYFDKYDTGKLAKQLGNTPEQDGDGFLYRGRGDVQITGKANYLRFSKLLGVDLVNNPDKTLDPSISAKIAVIGSRDGLFTGLGFRKGRPVGRYDKAAYTRARQIINGTNRALEIAGYAIIFEQALRSI